MSYEHLKSQRLVSFFLTLLIIITSNLFNYSANAADGDLDLSFDGDGIVIANVGADDSAESIAIQTDGKIVIAGTSQRGGLTGADFALLRYNTDGSLDTTFDGDGIATADFGNTDDYLYAMAIQADNKIVVAGYSSQPGFDSDFALARFNTDGSLDTTFDGDGKVLTNLFGQDERIYSIAIQGDGKIVAAGYSEYDPDGVGGVDATQDFALARYNTNGSLDTTFDGDGKTVNAIGGGSDRIQSIVLRSDGKILAAGYANFGNIDFTLVRYNTDGSLDTTFDGDGIVSTSIGTDSFAESMTLQSDGKIIIAGYTSPGDGDFIVLARYNADGSLDTTFSGDGKVNTRGEASSEQVYSIALQSNGKIVVSGISDNGDGARFFVAKYNTDGTLDTSFSGDGKVTTIVGIAGNNSFYAVAIQNDGKIVAAGHTQAANNDFALIRYVSSNLITPAASTNDASEAAAQLARQKAQQELTEILSLIPELGKLALNLSKTSLRINGKKCVKKGKVKYVPKSTKCPVGYQAKAT